MPPDSKDIAGALTISVPAEWYQPQPHQLRFHTLPHRFRAFIAGIGAGKTLAGCAEALRVAVSIPTESIGMILAPTYPMLRDATMRTFFSVCPEELIATVFKSQMTVLLRTGAEILFRSADDPEKLRGPNLAWVYLDEAAMMPRRAWEIAIGRLRREPGKAWITSTPKGRNWIYDLFVLNPQPDYGLVRASTFDNAYLPPELTESLNATYIGKFREQELFAEFVGFEGLVYENFAPDLHVQDRQAEWRSTVAGVDWGFNNPGVILVIGQDGDGNYHVLDEEYEPRVVIAGEGDCWVKRAQALMDKWRIERFIADPSEPANIQAFCDAGLPCEPADNTVMPGIAHVASLLEPRDGTPRLTISPRCRNLIRELQEYVYPESSRKDAPIKENDHACDALRYALYTRQQQIPQVLVL